MSRLGIRLSLYLPLLWLLLFVLLPLLIVLKISLAEPALAQPPYTALLSWQGGWPHLQARLYGYRLLLQDELYLASLLQTLKIAGLATLGCLLLGYPMAYAIARARPHWRGPLLLLVILPFWTSFLLRVYAWIGLLREGGPINGLLQALGLIGAPLPLLHSGFAVLLGMIYAYLPFLVLPLTATLMRLDPALLEAAADLGAPPARRFLTITLPLSLPGVLAGCLLVFIPALGEFVIPDLLGGPGQMLIGRALWNEFFANGDWPAAAALTLVLLLLIALPMRWLSRQERAQEPAP
jgi:putrescine transport system permease protein